MDPGNVLYFRAMPENDGRTIVDALRAEIRDSGDWYRALLRAVRKWPLNDEQREDEQYVYLLDGEALDLLRLCERLCLEIEDLVPQEQMLALLANDKPPHPVSRDELRTLIGLDRYRAYLSYIYGVMVEEMVQHAVLEDLRKRRRTSGLTHFDAALDEAFVYLYGGTRAELFESFRKERGLPRRRSVTLTQMKLFTYWLFKLRFKSTDRSRVASDTKRALTLLHRYTGAAKSAAG